MEKYVTENLDFKLDFFQQQNWKQKHCQSVLDFREQKKPTPSL